MEHQSKAVSNWLFTVAFMVFVMAVVGAITRLTESGLSIAEWKPLAGALPPMSVAEWERVFALYQQTPQYHEVFAGMTLAEFKGIFWWEWIHRFWGRIIGVAFALPMVWFWCKGQLTPRLKRLSLLLLLLGGLQGAVGWYMVASGLVDQPDVSHYRLAMHLSLALFLYVMLLATGLYARGVARVPVRAGLRAHGLATMAVLATTIVWGAFVAGLDAGRIYNEWPLMGGHLVPSEALHMQPLWLNAFENHATVQFIHRWLAIVAATMVLALALRARKVTPKLAAGLAIMALVQPLLGIVTLLTNVHTHVAATHQAGGIVLLGLLTLWLYRAKVQA